ncbi:MAG: universal stress protein [Cyanobacteria bacterium SZAS-4]|nr:universal stress protein [Cyanobacteria bacterium SZAS-4]
MTKILVTVKDNLAEQPLLDAISKRIWPERTSFKLVHVMDEPPVFFDITDEMWERIKNYRALVRQELASMEEKLRELVPGADIDSELLDGAPVKVILKLAQAVRADLIIVGKDDKTDIDGKQCGRFVKEFVCKAPCSVLVVG